MLERMKRGQLDVVMSGGMMCMKLAPSMRVLRLLGMFQSGDEASYVLGRLRPTIDTEMASAGFHNFGEAALGSDLMFSRKPITTLAELKRTRTWMWDLDETMRAQLELIGFSAVPLPVEEAARAYDSQKTDAFLAIPAASLAFQWSAQAKFLSDLHLGYLPGCMIMINRAWDSLPVEARSVVTVATARTQARLEELARTQDEELIGGLFARQGLKRTPVSATFSSDFFDAARGARQGIRDKLVPGDLMNRVSGWLADYRAEHQRGH
jgi:TRAP-type C4-dicarboxylate transport system substrate-binding protein